MPNTTQTVNDTSVPASGPLQRLLSNRKTGLLALGVFMLIGLVLSLGGRKAPPLPASTTSPASSSPNAELEAYRQLAAQKEQQLKVASETMERAKAQQAALQAQIQPGYAMPYQQMPSYPAQPYQTQQQRASIAEKRREREYDSLFASPLALSYRAATAPQEPARSVPVAPVAAPPPPAPPISVTVSQPVTDTLRQGTLIEAVLLNKLGGSFAGPVIAQVSSDVFSTDGKHLLIPRGSRFLGTSKAVDQQGQKSLAVEFDQLQLPNGPTVDLGKSIALDQSGLPGLSGKVNNHTLSTIGGTVATGLLGGLSLYNTGSAYAGGGFDMYRQGVTMQMGSSASRILDRALNRLPSVTVPEGTRMVIYLAKEITLSEYRSNPS